MKVKTSELDGAQQVINVRMRDDLAEMGLLIPASKTFEGYDNMVDDIVVSAEELKGAIVGDDPADPDDHAFCYVKLKDGRCLYFLGVDLDFTYQKEVCDDPA